MRIFKALIIAALALAFLAPAAWAGVMDEARAGAKAQKAGKWSQCIEHFKKALDMDGLSPFNQSVVHEMRADCYEEQGKLQLAIEDYNKALSIQSPEMKPRNRAIQLNARGLCYIKMKKDDRALPDFNKAIEIEPNYHHPYLHRTRIYKRQGKIDLAIVDIKRFIQLKPDDKRGPALLRELSAMKK